MAWTSPTTTHSITLTLALLTLSSLLVHPFLLSTAIISHHHLWLFDGILFFTQLNSTCFSLADGQRRLTLDSGPVTDYGASVVHYMRHRQPRYRGSYAGEVERPSPSYIVDVRTNTSHEPAALILKLGTDATTIRPSHQSSRLRTIKASSLFPQQNQAPHQCGTMDARRTKVVNGQQQWRVYALERHRV